MGIMEKSHIFYLSTMWREKILTEQSDPSVISPHEM
jgi:hypothetical protein